MLWWLFLHKGVMPWDAYEAIRQPGYRNLTYALASYEGDRRVGR